MIQARLPIPQSILVICPWCYDVWARLEGNDHETWAHRYVPCTLHPQAAFAYGCDFAGCLCEADLNLVESLPLNLLKREFELTLSNSTKELE